MRARVSWLLTPSTIAAAVLLVRGRIRVLLVSATTWLEVEQGLGLGVGFNLLVSATTWDVTGWWVVGGGWWAWGKRVRCVARSVCLTSALN